MTHHGQRLHPINDNAVKARSAGKHRGASNSKFFLAMQAADIIFASTAYPLNVLQIPLHKLMGTGYLAAAIAFWTLKVQLSPCMPAATPYNSFAWHVHYLAFSTHEAH